MRHAADGILDRGRVDRRPARRIGRGGPGPHRPPPRPREARRTRPEAPPADRNGGLFTGRTEAERLGHESAKAASAGFVHAGSGAPPRRGPKIRYAPRRLGSRRARRSSRLGIDPGQAGLAPPYPGPASRPGPRAGLHGPPGPGTERRRIGDRPDFPIRSHQILRPAGREPPDGATPEAAIVPAGAGALTIPPRNGTAHRLARLGRRPCEKGRPLARTTPRRSGDPAGRLSAPPAAPTGRSSSRPRPGGGRSGSSRRCGSAPGGRCRRPAPA